MTNPIYKLLAAKFRHDWKHNDDIRDAKHSIPDTVEVIRDISYGPHGKWNLLDVNLPKNVQNTQNDKEKLPCIVSIHGGGFFYGTKETYRFYAADLARRGFAVINFNYRLSPENTFPTQLEDCNAVIQWLEKNADKYNIDTNRVFLVGDSAGGNLVYHYSTIATNPEFQKLFDFAIPSVKPKAVALNCGVYEYDDRGTDLLRRAYVGSKKKYTEHLNIKKYVTSDFPSTFIISAPNDFLLNQMQPMVDFLTSRNIPVIAKVYGTKDNPLACHVFNINISIEIARQCNDDECDFFKSF